MNQRVKAAVKIERLYTDLDTLIADMTAQRDDAPSGDPLRADFRASCKHLEKALDHLDRATVRLV